MGVKTNGKDCTRTHILNVATEIVMEKGYNNTGLQEVLERASVPKGSFYYYFPSKEEFGLAIINHFNDELSSKVLCNLVDPSVSATARLRAYCQSSREKIESSNCRRGCLVGNLSQEMANQSEILRRRLEQIFSHWRDLLAACMADGQEAGEIRSDCSAQELADLFLSGWEGAIMRSKTTKSPEPMKIFIKIMFDHLLKPAAVCQTTYVADRQRN